MLTIRGANKRLCDGLSRRDFLRVGALGAGGHWKFDEAKGAVAKDSSGKGNHGKIHEATWTEGKAGGALLFNGKNAFVDCG